MGENNMFEGLGEELNQSEDSKQSGAEADSPKAEPAAPADTPEPATSDTPSSRNEPSTEASSPDEETPEASDDASPNHDQPAFPFVNNHVESIYPRPETWDAFRDVVDLDLERTFREHGVRNMSGREIHDAALRLAAENPEALARIALEARGIDYEP
jgi:hypothetical protein